jgi:transporter family-2 protein
VDRTTALIVTLLAGALVAAQPPVNAMMARHVTDLGAAFVSLAFSTLIVGVLLVAFGDVSALRDVTQLRPVHAIAGIAGAAIVVVSLVAVRELGAGGVTAALVTTQLSVSVLLDRLGVLGLHGHAVTTRTLLGVALLFGGTYLVVGNS